MFPWAGLPWAEGIFFWVDGFMGLSNLISKKFIFIYLDSSGILKDKCFSNFINKAFNS